MRKTIYLLTALLLPPLFYRSKRSLISPIVRPVLNIDSIRPDSSDVAARLFASDASGLRKLSVRRKAAEEGQIASSGITRSIPPVIAQGTNITSSAASVSSIYPGIDRVKRCEFIHHNVPGTFDSFRIAFTSDLHYKSLFKEKGLEGLVHLLNAQHADVLLMRGNYQEGCQSAPKLFAVLARMKTPLSIHGVMGNNGYRRRHDEITREMRRYDVRSLEHRLDTLRCNGEQVILIGVRNPSDLANNGVSPTLSLSPANLVILLVHTPDCVEDVPVAGFDLILTGHTHGGQVCILDCAPIISSHCGDRFLTGLRYNPTKIPTIVTSGIGASDKNIRIGVPAEIVTITLHHLRNEQL